MKKSQKKAIRTLIENQSKGQKELTYNCGTEDELKVTVVSAIPYTKRMEMIEEIVSYNFSDEATGIEGYMPAALEFAKRYIVLKYYTDLTFPDNIDEIWLLLNHTTIYNDVFTFVENDIREIYSAADKMISAKLAYLTQKSDLNLFLNKITSMIGKFNSSLENIDMEKLVKLLENLSQFSATDLVDAIFELKPKSEETIQSE